MLLKERRAQQYAIFNKFSDAHSIVYSHFCYLDRSGRSRQLFRVQTLKFGRSEKASGCGKFAVLLCRSFYRKSAFYTAGNTQPAHETLSVFSRLLRTTQCCTSFGLLTLRLAHPDTVSSAIKMANKKRLKDFNCWLDSFFCRPKFIHIEQRSQSRGSSERLSGGGEPQEDWPCGLPSFSSNH